MQLLPTATKSSESRQRCAQAILEGLPQVMWFIRYHMRRRRAEGLTVPQFRTLLCLDRFPTVSISGIAEHLGCSLPAASRTVQKLVTKGLVDRTASALDRRQMKLVMMPRGRLVLAEARRATVAQLAEAIAHLDEAQARTVLDAMTLLRDLFSNGHDKHQRG